MKCFCLLICFLGYVALEIWIFQLCLLMEKTEQQNKQTKPQSPTKNQNPKPLQNKQTTKKKKRKCFIWNFWRTWDPIQHQIVGESLSVVHLWSWATSLFFSFNRYALKTYMLIRKPEWSAVWFISKNGSIFPSLQMFLNAVLAFSVAEFGVRSQWPCQRSKAKVHFFIVVPPATSKKKTGIKSVLCLLFSRHVLLDKFYCPQRQEFLELFLEKMPLHNFL